MTVVSSDTWNSTLSMILFTIYYLIKYLYSSVTASHVVATIIIDIWLLKSAMLLTNTIIQKSSKHNFCHMKTILCFLRMFPSRIPICY